MADRMPAQIWIGGKLPRSLLEDFPARGLATNWDGSRLAHLTEESLLRVRDEDGLLTFCDEDAWWGEFEELERWLMEHKMPFRRQSDGKYEYLPEIVEFRPDLGHEGYHQTICSDDGEPLLYSSYILPIVKEMEKTDDPVRLRALVEQLRTRMPPEFPPLPPFEIVED